jgi:sodium-coupled neutral amino acid transporter 11
MIGSGILVQPYAFKESGILLTTCLYIAISFMNYYGVLVLVRTAEFTGYFDYALIAMTGLGPLGAYAVDISIVLMDVGALISYILIIGDLCSTVLSVILNVSTSTWYISETFCSAIVMTFIVMPFCLIRRLGHLACISYLAFVVVFFIVLLVCVDGPLSYEYTANEDALRWFDISGAFDNIGSMVFAMGYTPSVLHAYVSLEDSKKRQFPRITLLATFLGAALCYITGLVGYLCFRDDTESDILDNFTDTWANVTKFLVIIHLIFYIPGDFIVMRSSIYHLVQYSGKHQWKSKKSMRRVEQDRSPWGSMKDSEKRESARLDSQTGKDKTSKGYLSESEDEDDDEGRRLMSRGNNNNNRGGEDSDGSMSNRRRSTNNQRQNESESAMPRQGANSSNGYGSMNMAKRPVYYYYDQEGNEILLDHSKLRGYGYENKAIDTSTGSESSTSNKFPSVTDRELDRYIADHVLLDDVAGQDNVEYVLTSCILVLIITFCTCVIEYYTGTDSNVLSFVVNLTGGVAGSLCTFILPGLCGMAFLYHKPKYYYRSLAVFGFGCVICICVLVGSVS